jgi:hypothetical protein
MVENLTLRTEREDKPIGRVSVSKKPLVLVFYLSGFRHCDQWAGLGNSSILFHDKPFGLPHSFKNQHSPQN